MKILLILMTTLFLSACMSDVEYRQALKESMLTLNEASLCVADLVNVEPYPENELPRLHIVDREVTEAFSRNFREKVKSDRYRAGGTAIFRYSPLGAMNFSSIWISKDYLYEPDRFNHMIVHEMVHVYQFRKLNMGQFDVTPIEREHHAMDVADPNWRMCVQKYTS